jgi:hypothetical protein
VQKTAKHNIATMSTLVYINRYCAKLHVLEGVVRAGVVVVGAGVVVVVVAGVVVVAAVEVGQLAVETSHWLVCPLK